MAFEKYFIPEPDEPKMSIHLWVAILSEYLSGEKDPTEARGAIEAHLGVTLSTNETADIVATLAYVNAGTTDANKRNRLDEVYRVAILGEQDTWYNTVEAMRTRLNWSEPD